MNRKSLVIFCIFLLMSIPFTSAEIDSSGLDIETTDISSETFEGDTEDISVQVGSYEPPVLVSALLEQQQVPIYANLFAITTKPLASTPEIERVSIRQVGGNRSYVGSVGYRKPDQYSFGDLGYIELRLKQIPKESDVPNNIEVDLEADIRFKYQEESSAGQGIIGMRVLEEDNFYDEKDLYAIQEGRGYLRLRSVVGTTANFVLYDESVNELTKFGVREGSVSNTLRLDKESNEYEDKVRIRVDDIKKGGVRAEISIAEEDYEVTKGDMLVEDFPWKVSAISPAKDGKKDYIVLTRGSNTVYIVEGYESFNDLETLYDHSNQMSTEVGLKSSGESDVSVGTFGVYDNKRLLDSLDLLKSDLTKSFGEAYYIHIKNINEESEGKATFRVADKDGNVAVVTHALGEELARIEGCTVINEDYKKCTLEDISDNYVKIRVPVFDTKENGERVCKADKIVRLNLNDNDNTDLICDKTFQLANIDSGDEVDVSVLAGEGEGRSLSRFSLNIPVEKRPINLTTDEIDKQINETLELIENLNKTISTLEEFTQTLAYACYGVMALATVGRFFSSGVGPTARLEVAEVYHDRYADYKTKGGDKTYNDWLRDSSLGGGTTQYEKDVSAMRNSLKTYEDQIKSFNFDEARLSDVYEGGDPRGYDLAKGAGSLNSQDQKDLIRYKMIMENTPEGSILYTEAESNYNSIVKRITEVSENYDDVRSGFEQSVAGLHLTAGTAGYFEALAVYQRSVRTETDAKSSKLDKSKIFQVEGKFYYYDGTQPKELIKIGDCYSPKGTSECYKIQGMNVNAYDFVGTPDIQVNSKKMVTVLPLTTDKCFYTGSSTENFDLYKNGLFIRIEYHPDYGRVEKVYLYNVGQDGVIGGKGDQFVSSYSRDETVNKDAIRDFQRFESCIKDANEAVAKGDSKVRFEGKSYQVNDETTTDRVGGQCQDVMSAGMCKMVFLVCDPVMCPSSRCNLNGKYQVDNVIQSGIVGSAVLCLPKSVCLSGIVAGLKNLQSVFQGYHDCLVSAKIEQQSIGICNEIRSIWLCDIIWREVMTILKLKGGLLKGIFNKAEELSGGGEYVTGGYESAKQTVDYFTNNYANNVFDSYKGRSTNEIGAEICKSVIFGEGPSLGDLFEDAVQLQNPVQFTAYFTEAPHSARAGTSRYDVYYHIYAGDEDVSFQVYLQGAEGNVKFGSGSLRPGEFADESVYKVAGSGMQEICVVLNGQKECGFGKIVSSSAAISQMGDMYAKYKLTQNVNSESDCRDEMGVNLECAVNNPGKPYGEDDKWVEVGSCGKDDLGNSLGKCWMEKESLKDATSGNAGNIDEEILEAQCDAYVCDLRTNTCNNQVYKISTYSSCCKDSTACVSGDIEGNALINEDEINYLKSKYAEGLVSELVSKLKNLDCELKVETMSNEVLNYYSGRCYYQQAFSLSGENQEEMLEKAESKFRNVASGDLNVLANYWLAEIYIKLCKKNNFEDAKKVFERGVSDNNLKKVYEGYSLDGKEVSDDCEKEDSSRDVVQVSKENEDEIYVKEIKIGDIVVYTYPGRFNELVKGGSYPLKVIFNKNPETFNLKLEGDNVECSMDKDFEFSCGENIFAGKNQYTLYFSGGVLTESLSLILENNEETVESGKAFLCRLPYRDEIYYYCLDSGRCSDYGFSNFKVFGEKNQEFSGNVVCQNTCNNYGKVDDTICDLEGLDKFAK